VLASHRVGPRDDGVGKFGCARALEIVAAGRISQAVRPVSAVHERLADARLNRRVVIRPRDQDRFGEVAQVLLEVERPIPGTDARRQDEFVVAHVFRKTRRSSDGPGHREHRPAGDGVQVDQPHEVPIGPGKNRTMVDRAGGVHERQCRDSRRLCCSVDRDRTTHGVSERDGIRQPDHLAELSDDPRVFSKGVTDLARARTRTEARQIRSEESYSAPDGRVQPAEISPRRRQSVNPNDGPSSSRICVRNGAVSEPGHRWVRIERLFGAHE